MNNKIIYGIQQIGVGVTDSPKLFEWYATHLGADVRVFDDDNTATYMAPYMGGKPRDKRAILAVNLQGGSGYEIWQHTEHKPVFPSKELNIGNLGINVASIKSHDIERSYSRLKSEGADIASEVVTMPDNRKCFYVKDPCGNMLQIKEFSSWYNKKSYDMGGICGCILGVSNIDKSLKLYSEVLGYDNILYDKTGEFDDLKHFPNGNKTFRRVLLGHTEKRKGGFAALFGDSELELIQMADEKPEKLFKGRYWGDIGFIHLCFDIKNMDAMVEECKEAGFPFTVLSNADFDMGDANGHWGYLEDPDGTLVEFVETHKVPLLKKPNISINLKKRDPLKPLPNWLIKAMRFNRVKF